MDNAIRWQVWRQDDNGARFLIASYDTEDEARTRLARMEATGGHHKQLYWTARSDRPLR
ncbi:MAG TPA: SPOR domain-containing protein [Yinghuangia sp.]|uniref:SPOR domain-containing protein n=1 Tax=Yinghuangia sp. YIM S10712 TaxID=3436930 RepID=UPI002BCF5E79|nr:SPOR domain-containing protein [Yinghuangia sp.]